MFLGFRSLPPAPFSTHAGEAPRRPSRHMCHWLPCGRAKRVRHIVYRVFELGLRPLPPASLSKYSYYYELPCGVAKPVRHIFYRALGFALAVSLFDLLSRHPLHACGRAKRVCETFGRRLMCLATVCDAAFFCYVVTGQMTGMRRRKVK